MRAAFKKNVTCAMTLGYPGGGSAAGRNVPLWTNRMSTLEGNCHCKAVTYTVRVEGPVEDVVLMKCNCSTCRRRAAVNAIIPDKDFTINSGKDHVKVIQPF